MKHFIVSLAVCLIVIGSMPGTAKAIPSMGDYTFTSTFVNGTFTSSGTALTAWHFVDTYNDTTFSGADPVLPSSSIVALNDPLFFWHISNHPTAAPSVEIFWDSNQYESKRPFGINGAEGEGGRFTAAAAATVPEPSTYLLFGSGLLGLAGYRWSQRRRERTQLG